MRSSSRFRRALLTVAWAAVAGALCAPPAAAQIKGPTTCFKCHKPQARTMWETQAPFHKTSTQQLTAPKAAAFAAAIGLASPSTVTGKPGDCVSCHATVVGGAPSIGVSCESCHGPAGQYLNPHQEPEFYAKPESARLGLRDLYNKPAAIAAMCVDCHVTPDPRLKKAGHPSGEGFDPGKGIAKMVHWDSGVSTNRKRAGYGAALYGQISGAAPALVAKRMAAGGAAVASATAPVGPAKGAPAAGPPAVGAPPPGPAVPSRGAPTSRKAPDPFDWDQPVAELPRDYPGNAGSAPAAPSASAPAATASVTPPAGPRPLSTAPEAPSIPQAPALTATAPPAGSAPGGPQRPPVAPVTALRGRGAAILGDLLKSKGAKQLATPAPSSPKEFDGPDGELLRLQDEILYLALETLRKPQP